MADRYTTIQIRIFRCDPETGLYPVEAKVTGGGDYSGRLDVDLNVLLYAINRDSTSFSDVRYWSIFSRSKRPSLLFSARAHAQEQHRRA